MRGLTYGALFWVLLWGISLYMRVFGADDRSMVWMFRVHQWMHEVWPEDEEDEDET